MDQDHSTHIQDNQLPVSGDQLYQPVRSTISLLDLVAVLMKQKLLIAGVTLGAIILLLAINLLAKFLPAENPLNLVPDTFTSEVQIYLTAKNSSGSLSNLLSSSSDSGLAGIASLAGLTGGGVSPEAALAQELLKSRPLLDSVAEDLDLYERLNLDENPKTAAREFLSDNMTVEYKSDSGIFSITFEDTDREFTKEIIDTVVVHLERFYRSINQERNNQNLAFVEERVEEFARNKDLARQRLKTFQEKNQLFVPLGTAASAAGAAQSFQAPQLIAEYTAMIVTKQLEIQGLLEYLSEDAAQVRRLRNEITLLQNAIRELRYGDSENLPIDTIPESQINQVLLEYQDLARELQLQESLYSQFLLQAESIRIQNSDKTSTFQVIGPAEVPEKKSAPSRAMIMVVGTAGAFFLAVFLAFFREYLQRVKQDPEEGKKLQAIKESARLFPKKGAQE